MPISSAGLLEIELRLARNRKPVVKESFTTDACDDESELHGQIKEWLKLKGWIGFHGSMAHRSHRTIGEPDWVILADGGQMFLIECKTKKGKLTVEQAGIQAWCEKLGHRYHVVRSFQEFLGAVTSRCVESAKAP